MEYYMEKKMKNRLSKFLVLTGIFLFCFGIVFSGKARAQSAFGAQKGQKVGTDLQQIVSRSNQSGLVDVIIQIEGKPSGQLNALLNRNGVRIRAKYYHFNYIALRLPAAFVNELSSFSEVSYVSLDRKVESFGHVSSTTGADAVRTVSYTHLTLPTTERV